MSNRAWVTLATNDSYGLGALVLANSLRRVGSEHPAVVLITPSVTDAMRERLNAVFSDVVTVDVLDSGDAAHLALLQRPELGITFTKIHCWNLTQFHKCVFLDADTLVVQNCDELFERDELSAAPDVGWPDCFNSGVFVFKPSAETFSRLIAFAQERGSFDGGDQGLLNSFFSDWARGDISKHLPFLYNVTSAAFYSYLPALKHFGQDLKIIHFIGAAKPWLQHFNFESRTVDAPDHIRGLLQLWWDIFVGQVHSQLDATMSGVAGNLARVVAGGPHEALDDLTRRQGWEAGNIDYMGADSFDKIWAKISQTLTQPRSSPSPPKESPPREIPVQAGEVAKEVVSEPIEVAKEALPVAAPPPVVTTAPDTPKAPKPAPVSEPTPALVPEPTPAPVSEPTPAPVSEPVPAPVSELALASEPVPVPVSETVPVPVSEPIPVPVSEPVLVPVSEPTPAPAVVSEPTPVATPVEDPVPASVESPKVETPAPEVSAKIETPPTPIKPAKLDDVPVTVAVEAPVEEPKKTETAAPAAPKSEQSTPSTPVKAVVAPVVTSEKVVLPSCPVATDGILVATDSPPLANTPSKEEAPAVPAAKSTEEAAQETRL